MENMRWLDPKRKYRRSPPDPTPMQCQLPSNRKIEIGTSTEEVSTTDATLRDPGLGSATRRNNATHGVWRQSVATAWTHSCYKETLQSTYKVSVGDCSQPQRRQGSKGAALLCGTSTDINSKGWGQNSFPGRESNYMASERSLFNIFRQTDISIY